MTPGKTIALVAMLVAVGAAARGAEPGKTGYRVTNKHQDSVDAYTLLENVKTMRGAKTLGFDSKTGKLFSATVENVPPNATSQPAPLGKVAYEPGPFVVVEIGK
jgi:hypothetical protein